MLKIYQLRKKQNTFEVTLKYKGVGVRVLFENGNNYNNIPAKCYTNDPFKQRAIENSEMFRNKEIVLERTVEEAGDRKAAVAKTVRVSARAAKSVAGQKGQPKKTEPAKVQEPVKTPEPDKAPEPEKAKTDEDLTPMSFNNLGEAIQYIAQNYQIAVQTDPAARKVLKEHGINPTIKKG